MGMHTIPMIYDPTTRRISLAPDTDTYGGATTDVNSVTISFTGIVPEGTDFIARVDFGVWVKVDNRTVEHPFILLEQDNDTWSAIIPNAVLAATKNTHKLPIQLVLANDSQVINSRNAVVLEVTMGIAASTSEIPEYEMPEWPLPTGVSESIDVLTITAAYDPQTRMLTLSGNDNYGGATIDTLSVRINITGIEPIGTDFSARLDFATPIRVDNDSVIKPFVVLEQIGTTYSAMIPQAVLMSAKETKKLPFQLVTRHGDTIVNSRNTIVLEITRAINAMESVDQAYTPYVMFRNDTWEWLPDYTYGVGAVVLYDNKLYASTAEHNINNVPSGDSEYWTTVSSDNIGGVILDDIVGTKDSQDNICFTSEQVFAAAHFAKTAVSLIEQDTPLVTYEFPVKTYTNEGYPLIETLHFGDLITGNDKFVMTNYDYGNDRRTANIYLYKYYGNEDRYDLLASMDANSIYHSGNNYLNIPLIVSSQMVVIWRLTNDTAPQGNSISVYDFLNNTCGEYRLAYEGDVSPGENRYGELNIVFNGTSSEEQIQINVIRQYDQAQYEFGMSYDSTSYCWCPIDNTFVGMDHSYGYETDYIPLHWRKRGLAFIYDANAALCVDLNTESIVATALDFEPAYEGDYPSALYEFISIDDPNVIKTIEYIGTTVDDQITSVDATGYWHMDPDPEGWWDPDMPQGCVYKVANIPDEADGTYDMYLGFGMYVLPREISEASKDNPETEVSYTHVTGPIPDFTIGFGMGIENYSGSGSPNPEDLYLYIDTLEGEMKFHMYRGIDTERAQEDPDYALARMTLVIYADRDRVILYLLEGFAMIQKSGDTYTSTYFNMSSVAPDRAYAGHITCENGTMTLIDRDGSELYSFDVPHDFYRADMNGNFGRYDYTQLSNGIYANSSNVIPEAYNSDNTVFLYNSSVFYDSTAVSPAQWNLVKDGSRITEAYWTYQLNGETHRANAQTFILPKIMEVTE